MSLTLANWKIFALCSNCGEIVTIENMTHFCPFCHAMMDRVDLINYINNWSVKHSNYSGNNDDL